MISYLDDEEYDRFVIAAKYIMELLFPEMYQSILVVDPSFDVHGMPNIRPQFSRGDFFAVSSVEARSEIGQFQSDVARFSPSEDIEVQLESYRPTYTIFASSDLGVLTAWAQGDCAIVAFKNELAIEYQEWIESIKALGAFRKIG